MRHNNEILDYKKKDVNNVEMCVQLHMLVICTFSCNYINVCKWITAVKRNRNRIEIARA